MMQSRRTLLLGALAGVGVGALCCGTMFSMQAQAQAKPRIIKIEARKFVFTPNEITIKQGEQIILELTALDFIHGFSLPDFKMRTDIMPGKVTTLALNPTEVGRFTFLCDNFCGDGHETMNGSLIVEA
ncbi:MAG TPA: cupredoxin domain-containing protein [Herbaspirillum sp.]|nr:cupredoxin domain-containing protein [Herbaspirillum sp.]